MGGDVEVFLDTSVLFAAVHSEKGGARMILKLGEAGAVSLWIGPWVMREAEAAGGFEKNLRLLRKFLHDFGRETNQGEVVVEFAGRFFRIREYDLK